MKKKLQHLMEVHAGELQGSTLEIAEFLRTNHYRGIMREAEVCPLERYFADRVLGRLPRLLRRLYHIQVVFAAKGEQVNRGLVLAQVRVKLWRPIAQVELTGPVAEVVYRFDQGWLPELVSYEGHIQVQKDCGEDRYGGKTRAYWRQCAAEAAKNPVVHQ